MLFDVKNRGAQAAVVAVAAMSSLALAAPASATGGGRSASFTDVRLIARGGDATAVALCVNLAKAGHDITQINKCNQLPTAIGGDVTVNDVNLTVIDYKAPPRDRVKSYTRVSLVAEGGDATAVALCLNAAKAGDDVAQKNKCDQAPAAVGGSVSLNDVNLTVK